MNKLYSKESGILDNVLSKFMWTYKKEIEDDLDVALDGKNEAQQEQTLKYKTNIPAVK